MWAAVSCQAETSYNVPTLHLWCLFLLSRQRFLDLPLYIFLQCRKAYNVDSARSSGYRIFRLRKLVRSRNGLQYHPPPEMGKQVSHEREQLKESVMEEPENSQGQFDSSVTQKDRLF